MTPLAIFDLDGTLVDTAPDLVASLNHCLAEAGMDPVPLHLVRPHAGHGARVMLRQAYAWDGRPIDDAEMERQVAKFLAHYEANIAVASEPFAGVVDAMDRLSTAGFLLAICTNKFEHLAKLLLEKLQLAHRFAAICGADTFARRKPDPIHVTGTIERAGSARDRTIMIGDTITDIEAAAAADVASVLVDFGYAPDEAARTRADVVIESYETLDAAFARKLLDTRRARARI